MVVSLWFSVLESILSISRSGITGSYGSCISSFWQIVVITVLALMHILTSPHPPSLFSFPTGANDWSLRRFCHLPRTPQWGLSPAMWLDNGTQSRSQVSRNPVQSVHLVHSLSDEGCLSNMRNLSLSTLCQMSSHFYLSITFFITSFLIVKFISFLVLI